MEAVAQRVDARVAVRPAPARSQTWRWSAQNLKHTGANIALALTFFASALSPERWRDPSVVKLVWIAGAVIMGVFSLIRNAPSVAMINAQSVASSSAMLLLPCLMRPTVATPERIVLGAALALEIAGVVLSQAGRIYMGRSFGILPANRGVVSSGPFAAVRHPIYLGWILLAAGFALAYPSARNIVLLALSIPFIAWRIRLEENLLSADAAYRKYCVRVRFRLCPGLY